MNRTNSIWTPELDARLEERWNAADRPSTAKIARELGISKNAVIGRAHRRALPKRESPLRRPPAKFAAATASRCVSGITGAGGDCKFIAGDPLGSFARGENPFCGRAAQSGSPYCAEHHALCYVRPTQERLAEIERVAANAVREGEAA